MNVYCHRDAAEQATWFGDDIRLKADVLELLGMNTARAISLMMRHIGSHGTGLQRVTRPEPTVPRFGRTTVDCDDDQRWLLIHRSGVRIAVNMADDARSVGTATPAASILLQTRDGIAMTAEKLILPSHSATVLVRAVQ